MKCCLEGKNVFITGGGGVGKTFLVHKIVEELERQGREVMLAAPTGLAAQLIGGVTCHRAFKIPIYSAWEKEPEINADDPVCLTDAIVIDEISMFRMDAFNFFIKCIEDANAIRGKKGKPPVQIIAVGDFLQLPPVVVVPKDGSPSVAKLMSNYYKFDVGEAFAFQSPEWARLNFAICDLEEVVRQSDIASISILNRIRYDDTTALDPLMNATRKKPYTASDEGVVYLCGKNKTANQINARALDKLPGPKKVYYGSKDDTVSETDMIAPLNVTLCVGARVMILINGDHYANGSLGAITFLGDNHVCVKLDSNGMEVPIAYSSWDVMAYVVDKDKHVRQEVVGSYSLLPLRLCYAITIHKSQGQTLEKAVLIIGKNASEIFVPGQLYVGVSRVKDLKNLYIDGDLTRVKKLASSKVIDYYKSVGIDIPDFPVSKPEEPASAITSVKENAEDPSPVAKKTKKRQPKKAKQISPEHVTEREEVAVSVPNGLQTIILAFAAVLDPEAHVNGSAVYVSSGTAEAVAEFASNFS